MAVAPAAAQRRAAPAFDPATASIEENLQTPALSDKQAPAVVAAINALRNEIVAAGYTAQGVRSGQVLMVVIPCANIFAPNEIAVSAKGDRLLGGLKKYVDRRGDFKTIVAVHTDNTGDATYADRITADRADAIDEYYTRHNNGHDTGLIPYGIGSDEPVADNHGVANRARNRRVEIYFVPTQDFINKTNKR